MLLQCQGSALGRVGQASPLGKVILLLKESLCAAVSLFASTTLMPALRRQQLRRFLVHLPPDDGGLVGDDGDEGGDGSWGLPDF